MRPYEGGSGNQGHASTCKTLRNAVRRGTGHYQISDYFLGCDDARLVLCSRRTCPRRNIWRNAQFPKFAAWLGVISPEPVKSTVAHDRGFLRKGYIFSQLVYGSHDEHDQPQVHLTPLNYATLPPLSFKLQDQFQAVHHTPLALQYP